jgi:hypothetical protein
MRLEEEASTVDAIPHPIGTKASVSGGRERSKSRFVIEGPDIANAIFDSYAVKVKAEEVEELQKLVKIRYDADAIEAYLNSGAIISTIESRAEREDKH